MELSSALLHTTELKMLLLASILGLAQLILATHAATKARGVNWNMSARDKTPPPLEGVAARLDRAFKNFQETFPFFIGAVVVVQMLSKNSSMTILGAQLYLYARVVYVPVYAFGIPVVRTLIWLVSMVGIGMLLWAGCFN